MCYDHYPTLNLGLAWEHEWERDYGMNHSANWDAARHGFGYDDVRPGLPEWVTMLINKSDGTSNETYLSTDGGKINVSVGEGQSYLLYNGDTEYIMLSDMVSVADARASATSRSRSGMSYINEHHPDARSLIPPTCSTLLMSRTHLHLAFTTISRLISRCSRLSTHMSSAMNLTTVWNT
ncbi:MAG: hypothetical protein K2H98_10215 [Duncaniella sp.]|nr:hypothetical protein [Duncaniella sp.]